MRVVEPSLALQSCGLFAVLVFAACQGTPSAPTQVAMDHTTFDRLWTAYTRCLSSSDAEMVRTQADLLHQAAYREPDSRTFLPSTLDRYVEKPPTRLAADPRDLHTACRSHLAQIEQASASR